jgi:hypothetical protein
MKRALALLAIAAGLAACRPEGDALVLLDVRGSGVFAPPVTTLQLSAPGWPTRSIASTLGSDGVRVGYYGPGRGDAVTVTIAALDAQLCVVGSGRAAASRVIAGQATNPVTLFIRPLAPNTCLPDASVDATADASVDATADASNTAD